MIPADLLNQLREKDPELWEQITGLELAEYEYDDENGSMSGYIYQEDLIEGAQEAWLQHCLQEAIRWRGWAYQVSCTFQGTRFAKIATINPDGSKWFHDDQHAPTEAEALCWAYLAAIQEAT
jgi:hypothetical protein